MLYSLPTILNNTPGIIYISDNANKTVQWCNQHFEEETGYTLTEMKDLGIEFFRKIMHPDDFPRALEARAHFKANGEEFAGACRIKGKHDQDWHWLYGVAIPLNYDRDEVKEVICNFQKLKINNTPHQMHQAFNSMIKSELYNLIEKLTCREKEVLDLLLQGKANHTIADRLFISIDTLKTHRAHIREKLGADKLHLLIDLACFCHTIFLD